jgi:hypothetical protein
MLPVLLPEPPSGPIHTSPYDKYAQETRDLPESYRDTNMYLRNTLEAFVVTQDAAEKWNSERKKDNLRVAAEVREASEKEAALVRSTGGGSLNSALAGIAARRAAEIAEGRARK